MGLLEVVSHPAWPTASSTPIAREKRTGMGPHPLVTVPDLERTSPQIVKSPQGAQPNQVAAAPRSLLHSREGQRWSGVGQEVWTPAEDGLPGVGRSALTLGVRVPKDISPNGSGLVEPGTGGLSVAPDSLWNPPHHRRPRFIGRGSSGPPNDWVFMIMSDPIVRESLAVRGDPLRPERHAFIEPGRPMELGACESALTGTRPDWEAVWP